MKRMLRGVISCVSLVALVSCASLPARNMDSSVLVVPARYAIVKLAFDIATLRPVTLVSYDKGRDSGSVLMYVWSSHLREWAKIDMAEYSAGSFVAQPSRRVHILGSSVTGLPAGIEQSSRWAQVVAVEPSLNIMAIVNGLDKHMSFSGREWKWLAGRHGLKIEDTNWEQRRYGKYGKPGATRSAVPMPAEFEEMTIGEPVPVYMPAPEKAVVESPVIQEAPAAPVAPAAGITPPEDK